MRAAQGPRRAVNQSGRAFLPKAGEPLAGRADTETFRLGRFFDPKSIIDHSSDKKRSTARRKPGTFMHVHPGPPEGWFGSHLQHSGIAPDEQPTERSQLAGQTLGVGLVFVDAAPAYVGSGVSAVSAYGNGDLLLTPGEAQELPFTPSGNFFVSRRLLGNLFYERGEQIFRNGFE